MFIIRQVLKTKILTEAFTPQCLSTLCARQKEVTALSFRDRAKQATERNINVLQTGQGRGKSRHKTQEALSSLLPQVIP
ncbi:MAG: hypothetical protein LBJ01_02115 [Tannerella sp.]|jgi:hypothetical protein|nr:hypothetical protein [Tannerella sp.]